MSDPRQQEFRDVTVPIEAFKRCFSLVCTIEISPSDKGVVLRTVMMMFIAVIAMKGENDGLYGTEFYLKNPTHWEPPKRPDWAG